MASAAEHAEALARGGATRANAELAARREEEKQGGPNPVVNALRQAATDVLFDCETQCANEARLVREIGGLQVVGTAIHDSRRVDNQLRGRAGRQGDPGSTIFCLSMEDDLMRVYCPGWASSSVWDWSGMDDDTPLYSKVVDDQLASIQGQIEDFHATHRASTFDTDRIIDGQREAIYAVRRKVLTEGQARSASASCVTSSGSWTTRATAPAWTAAGRSSRGAWTTRSTTCGRFFVATGPVASGKRAGGWQKPALLTGRDRGGD